MRCGSKRTKSLSLSSLSVLSLCSLSRSPQTRTQRQHALLFEPRPSSPPLSFFALCTRNEYVLIKGEILFSSDPFQHTSFVCCTKRNEHEGECTLSSVQHTKKRTLRSTETALFGTEKSKTRVPSTDLHPKWFALFCTEKSKPGVPSTDLHPKWLSFHLLSLSAEIFSLHCKAHKTHALLHYYIIMAGEEETETFAFQAEINQLLSLIINVRSGTCFVCDVPLPESAS